MVGKRWFLSSRGVVLLALLVIPAGARAQEAPDERAGCNPLAAAIDCLLPFPSDHFLVDDPAMPSGKRVEIPAAAALRRATDGTTYDFTERHAADGFSHGTPILALFPQGIDPAGLPPIDGPTASLDGSTAVIDVETGAGVLHFAELDPRAEGPAEQALIVRPLVRLENGRRYVVAIRGLQTPDGEPVEAPEGFRRIRDGEAAGDPTLAPLAERYEREIFPLLEQAGIDRGSLQLAWDFTTRSRENATADLLRTRELALRQLEATPPAVEITAVEENPAPDVARRIHGTLTVPLFLERAAPGSPLARDEAGQVVQNGTARVPFTLQIPPSVLEADEPARLIQFGHGFFYSRDEVQASFARPFGEAIGAVTAAVDWWGMSQADAEVLAVELLRDPAALATFVDPLHQAMVNQMALTAAARTTLLQLPELQRDGEPLYDPAQIHFYGISQGHILGGTLLALSPHLERSVLSVGGANFSLMMLRARPFLQFLELLERQVPDALALQKYVALLQGPIDLVDPLTWAPHLLQDPLPGAPAERRVLIQYGLGDAAVPHVAAELHARALGVPLLLPASRPVPALPASEGPIDGSAAVQFDFGLQDPLPGTVATPPRERNPVHEGVRRTEAGVEQIDRFLRPGGTIENRCEGACTPE